MPLPDVDALAAYGGLLQNLAPIEDATTDEDSSWRNAYAANVAGMTQTVCRAMCRFTGHATTPGDPVSNVHFAVWGNAALVKPVVTKGGTGIYVVTWPQTVTDELGVTHSLNLADGWVNVNGSTLYHRQVTITSPYVATVYVFNSANALNDAVGVTFALFVR